MSAPDRILVYELADAAALAGSTGALHEVFAAAMHASSVDAIQFVLDPFSGWIHAADPAALHGRGEPVPKGVEMPRLVVTLRSDQAVDIAGTFITQLRTFFTSNANPLAAWGPLHLVPPDLSLADVQPVFRSATRSFAHWLCRYGVTLPLYRSVAGRGEVLGAMVEVRVTGDGAVIAYNARWSPITGKTVAVEAVPFFGDGDGADHDGDSDEAKPDLVYGHDNVRANRFLPYYLERSGHHGGLTPASRHSMVVDIVQKGQQVGPLVVGGSGQYTFEWFSWAPATMLATRAGVRRGTGAVVRLDPGVHNVTVIVTDAEYGTQVEFAKIVIVRDRRDA